MADEKYIKYITEIHRKICNSSTDEYFEVGPDSDGLGLVEVRYHKGLNNSKYMIFTHTQAKAVANALLTCALELEGVKDVKS